MATALPASVPIDPGVLYAFGLERAEAGGGDVLRWSGAGAEVVPITRWLALPSPAEAELLAALPGPVLDVGCGPARHVLALQRAGVAALGIDASSAAVRLARRRGASVHHGSVFATVPHAGEWGAALLLDGNVGIGGDPLVLLRRMRDLVRPGGVVLVELEPGVAGVRRERPRLERAGGSSHPFAWARVGPDAIADLAAASDLVAAEVVHAEGRAFALLGRRPPLTRRC